MCVTLTGARVKVGNRWWREKKEYKEHVKRKKRTQLENLEMLWTIEEEKHEVKYKKKDE